MMLDGVRHDRKAHLPIIYVFIHSALMFALTVVILGLVIDTKVNRIAADFANIIFLCSYFMALAGFTVYTGIRKDTLLLNQTSTLHFIGAFISLLYWIPRIDVIKFFVDTNISANSYTLEQSKTVVILVFGIIHTILCAFYFIASLIHLSQYIYRF